jgi:hypothetical protein
VALVSSRDIGDGSLGAPEQLRELTDLKGVETTWNIWLTETTAGAL